MIEDRNIKVAKEIDDVMLILPSLIRAIRAGKPVAEIVATEFANLISAVQGADQVSAELATERKVALQTIGYRSGELVDAFL